MKNKDNNYKKNSSSTSSSKSRSRAGRHKKLGNDICPKCANVGRQQNVNSFNPNYPETKGSFLRFIHNDRSLKPCYITEIIKEQRKEEYLSDHPFKDEILSAYKLANTLAREGRTWRKKGTAMKEWPMTKEEKQEWKDATEFYNTVMDMHNSFLKIIKLNLKFIQKGREVPERVQNIFHRNNNEWVMSGLAQEETFLARELVNRIWENLFQKYGEPQRRRQKKEKSRKIKGTFDKHKIPRKTLPEF